MSHTASQQILFEDFAPDHLDGALRLSQEAGWPHRRDDWALTLSVSTGVVAMDSGEVVGTALCSCFGDVATLNMIIVDQRMRGRGLGRELMNRVIAMAGARETRLVATTDGLPLYEKLGFVATGRIEQYQGIAVAAQPEVSVDAATGADIAALAAADLAASGMERATLLARIVETGTLLRAEAGFALLRRFGRGHVVGPVVARDAATARALMAAAASRLEGQFLRIDMAGALVPADYAESLGLTHAGGGTTMVRAPKSPTAISSEYKTFALVSQALG